MRRTCRLCSIQPKGLVAALAGFNTPAMCLREIIACFLHSWIAKCWILMCLALGVGRSSLTIAMAASLLMYRIVGVSIKYPNLWSTVRRYLTVLAAVTAAMNSASVLLVLHVDWSFDLYAMTPPA